MKQFRAKNPVKVNIAASWIAHASAILIGVFLMPYVLHTLGDAMYGTWILINSVAGYSALLYLGMGHTICRYVSHHYAREEWDDLNGVVSVVFFMYAGLGAVVLAIAGVVAWLAPMLHDWGAVSITEVRAVILILGLNTAISIPGSVFGGLLTGIQRFDIERSISLVSGISRLVMTVVFLTSSWGLLTLALIFLGMTIFENAASILFAYRRVKTLSIRWHYVNRPTLQKCFSFGAFAFLDTVAFHMINLTDVVIIGAIFGDKVIVPYFIAQRLCKFIATPITQIGQVFMPRAGQLDANSERSKLQRLVTKGIGFSFLLAMGFFVGAGFFGDSLIRTWIGPGYSESHLLLMWLLGAQIVAIPVDILRSILLGVGHVRYPALIHLAEAIANVALTLVLIHPLGLVGVAIGTVVPVLLLELGFLLPFALRVLKFDSSHLLRQALAPQLGALFALLGYSFLVAEFFPVQTGWIRLIAISVGGGAVLVAVWLGQARVARSLHSRNLSLGHERA
jgi:O-antigen/teichoic acid export membrane protein